MVRNRALSFCAILLTAVVFTARFAEAQDAEILMRGHLAAGEFGPARALADSIKNPALRDRALAQIAAAQAGVGARNASVYTASYIGSDLVRGQTLGDIGSMLIGRRFGGGFGGGPVADFDSLIELITSTIEPESWDEVGGPGSIDGFEGGVYVDGAGLLKRIEFKPGSPSLATIRNKAAASTGNADVRRASRLRKVSLTRLEKQAQMLDALGRDPDDVMKSLAGLYKIQYILIYPETGDIVLAGPAGDWVVNAEGRKVNVDTGQPVLALDDLVTCVRNAMEQNSRFGCSITPRKENLAAAQKLLAKPDLRNPRYREQLRSALGNQDIEVYGIDHRSRVARIIVEADYRMKLLAMDIEEGTVGVPSYLDLLKPSPDGKLPPSDVIRWWFALNYDALHATKDRQAFEIRGQGVKVLSETELVTETGERKHTGKSSVPAMEFAHGFTKHFDLLAKKYPVYAELRNVFDLALVAALLKSEDMAGQVGWHMTFFGAPKGNDHTKYQVELGPAAKEVATIMNHRSIEGAKRRTPTGFTSLRITVLGVSGGVVIDPNSLVKRDAIKTDNYGLMKAERAASTPKGLQHHAWWWD